MQLHVLVLVHGNDMFRAKKCEVAVELSAWGLLSTGLKADVVQYALVIPVLLHHLRFQKSIDYLQEHIGYKFKDRSLIQVPICPMQ